MSSLVLNRLNPENICAKTIPHQSSSVQTKPQLSIFLFASFIFLCSSLKFVFQLIRMPFSLFSSPAATPSIPIGISMPISNSMLPKLMITEGILKVLSGSLFFVSPVIILKNLLSPSTSATAPSPYPALSLSLIQSFGTQTLAFSIPLFLAARSDANSVRSRKIVYLSLLAHESFLGLGLLGQLGFSYGSEWWKHGFKPSPNASGGKTSTRKERLMALARAKPTSGGYVMPGGWEEEGEDAKVVKDREEQEKLRYGLWLWVAELMPFVLGRVWILRYKPGWFD